MSVRISYDPLRDGKKHKLLCTGMRKNSNAVTQRCQSWSPWLFHGENHGLIQHFFHKPWDVGIAHQTMMITCGQLPNFHCDHILKSCLCHPHLYENRNNMWLYGQHMATWPLHQVNEKTPVVLLVLLFSLIFRVPNSWTKPPKLRQPLGLKIFALSYAIQDLPVSVQDHPS